MRCTKAFPLKANQRFGWSHHHPPSPERYLIHLSKPDLDVVNTAMNPSPSLIQKIASRLEDVLEPRFTLICNSASHFGLENVTAIRTFHEKLFQDVSNFLHQQGSKLFEELDPLEESPFRVETDGIKIAKGLNAPTERNLHWDSFGNSPIRGLSYGPNKDLTGGKPRLADFSQFMWDHFQQRPESLLKEIESFSRLQSIRLEHYQQIDNDYSIALQECDPNNDIPLLLFNDHPFYDGPMHGVTPILKHSQFAKRPLNIHGW